jgi:hypothetical protein
MSHPANVRYNAINHRFWLQYCNRNTPTIGTLDEHLITPSDTLADRAAHLYLIPVCAWVNLTHGNTYIHEPFDFTIVNGQKSCDRIRQEAWDALVARQSMFSNPLPRFNLPTYSIHVDCGVYTVYPDLITASLRDKLFQSYTHNMASLNKRFIADQTPIFFSFFGETPRQTFHMDCWILQ